MKIKRKRSGITLVEILIAITIIIFAAVAIIQFYLVCLSLSEINKEETIAMADLTNMMEAIKCTPFSNIIVDFPNGVSDGPIGKEYSTIVGGYVLTDEHIVVTYVDQNSDPLEIMVSVSWNDRRGQTRTKYLVTKRTR
ncbi:MAG: prepilin-type N-terminal cleavage/methylation domain-containing protein [Candidatus Omnitrophica bacterium]|nr:prepilin-type N-terminal cleavage/methylation domain-containing protein [Candidatus Omnitrophota bacterium]